MQDKDIEKELKNSADKITVKSFSERWDRVKDRILIENEQQEVLAEKPVLATPEGAITRNVNNRKRNSLIIILSLFFCCIVILSIVLPITLRKNDIIYFMPDDFERIVVSEEQFFNEIENAGYEIINLSNFEVDIYKIITVNANEVKGGFVEINNEDIGYILKITFHDKTVQLDQDSIGFNKEYVANSTNIKYLTKVDEEIYLTDAFAQYKNLSYIIELISLEDNCTLLFDELFA